MEAKIEITEARGTWFVRIKVLIISAILISIGNCIYTWKTGSIVTPLAAVPALATMFLFVIVGCFLQEMVQKYLKVKLPTILFISLIAMFATIPGFSPIANFVITQFGKINLLALCTPILAYAGISIGKDMETFKKQGLAIIVVSLLTFFGTYVGSAIIAQIVLKITGVI